MNKERFLGEGGEALEGLSSTRWSSLKWKTEAFARGFRLGKDPKETKAPGPLSSEKEAEQERDLLWREGLDTEGDETGEEDGEGIE